MNKREEKKEERKDRKKDGKKEKSKIYFGKDEKNPVIFYILSI